MAKGDPKDPRGGAVVRSERATNSIVRSMEVLARRGRGLTAKGKQAVIKHIEGAWAETKEVLDGKKAAKSGFTLDDDAGPAKADPVGVKKAG